MNALGTAGAWRVMFVGPREESFEEIRSALSRRRGSFQVQWVQNTAMAPTRAGDLRPDVILVDDELGGADSIEVIRRLLLRAPQAAILVLVTAESLPRASRAVMAGARGFVARPLKPEDLITTMELALAQGARPAPGAAQPEQRGRVVVFCAPRGGTGRTTLAANTAVALATLGEHGVVLIDADYGAPAIDVALNLQARFRIEDLAQQVPNLDREYVDQVLSEHASGVRALLAPAPNETFEPPPPADIQEILAELKRLSGWVLVDLGLPLDELAFSFLDVADRIVVNVLPEMVGLRNTRCMLESMFARGYAEERLWLVASRSPSEGAISKADIEARLRLPVVYQIPDDNPLAMHSLNRGVPAVTSHPRSALARAIRSFAQELIADAGRATETAANTAAERGWLARLLGRAQAKATEAEPAPAPASTDGAPRALDLTDSLLVEACPYLGLPRDPGSRFPYPCTANHCCASEIPVQVDPAYQAETCFGGSWTPCPRFIAHLEEREAADDAEEQDGSPGYEEIVINASQEPVVEEEQEPVSDLSGSFVLQSCPYLGLADDDASRYPYPDPANCCHARDQVRPLTPAYQAKACFAGDWASCLQFKAGLSDSFFLDGPRSQALLEDVGGLGSAEASAEEVEVEGEYEQVLEVEGAGGLDLDDLDAPGSFDSSEPLPQDVLEPLPEREAATRWEARPERSTPAPAAERAEDLTPSGATGCPYLGLRDDANVHHSSPDMDHYCHAGDWPKPMPPSYQVNYCLSPHWSLCEHWEQATHAPAGQGNGDGDEPHVESRYLKQARERRGDVLNDLDDLAALYLGDAADDGDEDTGAGPADDVYEPEADGPAGYAVDHEPLEDACPYLGIENDPTRWVPWPHEDNYCQAENPACPIAAAYQIGTCFRESWRECPRCALAAERSPHEGVKFPDVLYVPPTPQSAPEEAPPVEAAAFEEAPAPEQEEAPVRPASGNSPCPYLGLEDDEDICHPTANAENHCHTRALPYAVPTSYQDRVCLVGDWQSCPRFLSTLDGGSAGELDEGPAVRAPRRGLPRWVRALVGVALLGVILVALYFILSGNGVLSPAWLPQFLLR